MQITFKSCPESKLLKIDEIGESIVGVDDSFRQEIILLVLGAVRNGDITPRTENGTKDPPDWPIDENSADKQEDKRKQFVRFYQLVHWLRNEKGFEVKTAATNIPSEGVPQSVSDLTNVRYDDLLRICSVENEEDFHGFLVKQDGLYVKWYDRDERRKLFSTERAVLAWHPTGEYDKPALPLPCTLGQLRFFVIEAGLTGIIDEETVHEVLEDRIEHDEARARLSTGEGAAPDSFEARVAAVNLTDERCIELAHSPHLGIADWTELTGVGCGKRGSYLIAAKAVAFGKWTEREIRDASLDRQVEIHRGNETAPLEFPCMPARLVEFIDAKPPEPHDFSVPDAFRQAVTESEQATDTTPQVSAELPEQAYTAQSGTTEKAATAVAPEKIAAARSGATKSASLVAKKAKLLKIINALESYAKGANLPFDPKAMPGPLGDDWNKEGSFHWLCARLDRDFMKAKTTFESYREGICAVQKYAKKSDFYIHALPHIIPIFIGDKKADQEGKNQQNQ